MIPVLRSGRYRPAMVAMLMALFCAIVVAPSVRAGNAASAVSDLVAPPAEAGASVSVKAADADGRGDLAPRRCLNGPCALPDTSAVTAPEPPRAAGEPLEPAADTTPRAVHAVVPTPPPRPIA